MGSHEQAVKCLESHAVSAQVTKHFVTIYSKTCNNKKLFFLFITKHRLWVLKRTLEI